MSRLQKVAIAIVVAPNILWFILIIASFFVPSASSEDLARVQEGMTMEQVRSLLGKPASIDRHPWSGAETWSYGDDSDTIMRLFSPFYIAFSTTGTVERTWS